MKRRGVRDTDPFDWEKSSDTSQIANNAPTTTPAAGANTSKDANNVDNQENMEPDNRLELRINEIDAKKVAPPRPQRAIEVQQPVVTTADVSPRKASASGIEHMDRNANKSNFVSGAATPNKSKEDKVDAEGDAVMAEHGNKAPSKRLALDMRASKTDGEDTTGGVEDEPPSPSPRIVPSDAATLKDGSNPPLVFGIRGGTMERRRRMHMPSSGRTTSFKFRSNTGMSSSTLGCTGDNSITQMVSLFCILILKRFLFWKFNLCRRTIIINDSYIFCINSWKYLDSSLSLK